MPCCGRTGWTSSGPGGRLAEQVSFRVLAGEYWALLGPNGAGKSTLLRILASYDHPTRGQVGILGHRLGRVNVFTLRPLIGYVTPHHPLQTALTVREVVLTGRDRDDRTAAAAGGHGRGAAPGRRADRAARGLGPLAGSRWPLLSQGERARTRRPGADDRAAAAAARRARRRS